jgi:hypothetical protein
MIRKSCHGTVLYCPFKSGVKSFVEVLEGVIGNEGVV